MSTHDVRPTTFPEILARCHRLAIGLGEREFAVHFNTLSGHDGVVSEICVFVEDKFMCGSRDAVLQALEAAQGSKASVVDVLSPTQFEWRPFRSDPNRQ